MFFKEENFMKWLRVVIPALAICIVQVACLAPMRSYSDTTPIPTDIQIPALAIRDQENSFVVVTEPNIRCYAVISFWTIEDQWSSNELCGSMAINP
jgi:hypothetical protein